MSLVSEKGKDVPFVPDRITIRLRGIAFWVAAECYIQRCGVSELVRRAIYRYLDLDDDLKKDIYSGKHYERRLEHKGMKSPWYKGRQHYFVIDNSKYSAELELLGKP